MDYKTLQDILTNSKEIAYNCKTDFANFDWYIMNLVRSELNTLNTILKLNEDEYFKECFILLRSVMEKLLYFWLMLQGVKHPWKTEYTITFEEKGKTKKEIRDEICKKWNILKSQRDLKFLEAATIKPHAKKDDVIIVKYELTGSFDTNDPERKQEPIPYYNFILVDYNPDIAHLSNYEILDKTDSPKPEIIYLQKYISDTFFSFSKILDNLILNRLIDDYQKQILSIHYHFFSKYTHLSMSTIDTEIHINNKYNYRNQDNKTYYKLILLYVAKFLGMYINFILSKFSSKIRKRELTEYNDIYESLKKFSKPLWFYDDEPTHYDIEVSNNRKYELELQKKPLDESITYYYKDPFERLRILILDEDFVFKN